MESERRAVWLRFYTPQGELVLTEAESEHQRADQERQRAEEERQRANAFAAEVIGLHALLKERDGERQQGE